MGRYRIESLPQGVFIGWSTYGGRNIPRFSHSKTKNLTGLMFDTLLQSQTELMRIREFRHSRQKVDKLSIVNLDTGEVRVT
jgi:hypothetical protein